MSEDLSSNSFSLDFKRPPQTENELLQEARTLSLLGWHPTLDTPRLDSRFQNAFIALDHFSVSKNYLTFAVASQSFETRVRIFARS